MFWVVVRCFSSSFRPKPLCSVLRLTNLVVVTSLSQLLEVQVVLSEWTYAYIIYIYITYILYQISSKFEPRPCVSWWFLRQSLFREKKVDGSIQTPEPRPSLDPRYLSGQKNCLGYLVIVWKNQSCYLSRTKLSLKHPLNTSSIYLESWIEISQTTIWRCSQLRISDTCIPDPCVYCMYSWRILCC